MSPHPAARVLIVEDDASSRRALGDHLAADGYEPLEAPTAAHARRLMREQNPTAAIIEVGLDDGDGLDLISEIRDPHGEFDARLPLIVVSARATEVDRIRGLERGADDYLGKPYGYGELRARLEALLRRVERRPGMGRLRVATLELDPRSREVWVEGQPVHLSKKEFGLARLLASTPTRTFTREELLREVWGFQSAGRTRTLDTHAHRLRRKLNGGRVEFVQNVWGVGYRMCESALLA